MEAGRHSESLYNSEPITILETLGRNTGWLAGSCALAKWSKEDAPHLIYLPEIPFSLDKFIEDVKEVYCTIGGVFVVVSEGLEKLEKARAINLNDAKVAFFLAEIYENKQLFEEALSSYQRVVALAGGERLSKMAHGEISYTQG